MKDEILAKEILKEPANMNRDWAEEFKFRHSLRSRDPQLYDRYMDIISRRQVEINQLFEQSKAKGKSKKEATNE